jgi:hypothetical protein
VDLAQNYAPLVTLGSFNSRDFFSARIGCQTYTPAFGMDLAVLCIKH